MASLSSGLKLGTGSTSSLLRSASSLQRQISDYQDSLQAYQYQNSAYTDQAYQSYKDYLNGRISSLNSSGGVTNAQKALTLTKTLESAMKSNISASITRENIQIMAGNATKADKYNLIVNQYQRAVDNGDLTLAQSLESQAYSLSQQIQYEAQQSAAARSALQTAKATQQGDIVTNLRDSLTYFAGLTKNTSEQQVNTTLKNWVQSNKATFQALGVNISTQQPNYFDVASGIVGAIYNHTVLQAQAEAPINPLRSQDLAMQAANVLNGATQFKTLAGNLTFQEIQQASADPSMFAYDSSTGAYKKTTQTGYQYQTFQNPDGSSYKALVPTYSGIVGGPASSKVYFLTPNETKLATNLGLNFTQDKLNANGTVGAGVQVQLTQNSPDWLKQVLGQNGVTNLFTDQNGDIIFKGASSSGQGSSYYTLVQDGKGLPGLFEHTIDGTTKLAGGAYGFNAGAAQLLINQGQQIQRTVSIQQQMQAAELKLASPKPLPQIQLAPPPQQQQITIPKISTPKISAPTINPQQPTVNPQAPASVNVQGGSFNLQGGGGGIRLQ